MSKKINQVKRLRFELDLKQGQLAEMLGCHRTLIAKIETGAAPLTPSIAEKLNKIVAERLTTK